MRRRNTPFSDVGDAIAGQRRRVVVAALPAVKAWEAGLPSGWRRSRAALLADNLAREFSLERDHWQSWSVQRQRLAHAWLPVDEW